jgi:hypothetical protein
MLQDSDGCKNWLVFMQSASVYIIRCEPVLPKFCPNWTTNMECTDKSALTFLSVATAELIVTKLATAERQTKNIENLDKFSLIL